MSKHQIIYTSCMRGIDGVNDGQQVFSYDKEFKDGRSDDVKSLFTYQVPSLPAGVLMNEEIATTMPSAFMFRELNNGRVSLTLNTYLGRDYMGSAGRFGNHLSHSIVCDFSDLDMYPCEIYESIVLRKSMEYEEVNNSEKPEYLPTPEFEKGYIIDPDSIIEFLGINNNIEYFKQMVGALLRFSIEKKRIIICDEPDNIAKWIAALHYVLPLDIAKRVNFTTYEFDPELSPAQICGVVSEGTRYNVTNYIASNRHYVFDFINNQFNSVDGDNIFLDFIDTVFSFSYDSLLEFHKFIMSNTTYRNCDEKYYVAYYLYNFLSEGISEITKDEFMTIVEFVEEYLTYEAINIVVGKLIEEKEIIKQFDNIYALNVLAFLLKYLDRLDSMQQKNVKQMVVDRLIFTLSTVGIAESDFVPVYDNIDAMARRVGLSLPAELMVQNNIDSLMAVLSQNVELWKNYFIVRIIGDYVKDMKVPVEQLYPNCSIGTIYYGIVQTAYITSKTNGQELVKKILDSFKMQADYYVNMVLNIEGYLNDMSLPEDEFKYLWNYFSQSVLVMEKADIDSINLCLEEYERYDEMYLLYESKINILVGLDDVRDYFMDYWNRWGSNTGYRQAYATKVLNKYYKIFEKNLSAISEKQQFIYASEILSIAMKIGVKDEFVNTLSKKVCDLIPLDKLSSEHQKIINDIYCYQRNVLKRKIEGRLLLFIIAIKCNANINIDNLDTTINEIMEVSDDEGVNFNEIEDNKVEDYFELAFESISKLSLKSKDFTKFTQLFNFSKFTQSKFMKYWCKVTYKNSKGEKNYFSFGEFLKFMFSEGTMDDQEMVGKYLCKLNKQKLEDLDDEMKIYFKRDAEAIKAWENIRNIASSTNLLLNNLSNLFKRK